METIILKCKNNKVLREVYEGLLNKGFEETSGQKCFGLYESDKIIGISDNDEIYTNYRLYLSPDTYYLSGDDTLSLILKH